MAYASIEKIDSISPLLGSKHLEKAMIDGRQYIVQKGEFREGSLCVLIQAGAVVPNSPQFAFLNDFKRERNRFLRGIEIAQLKFCGETSEGLVMKISDFPELGKRNRSVGKDISDILGITAMKDLNVNFSLSKSEAETLLSFYNCFLLLKAHGLTTDFENDFEGSKLYNEDDENQQSVLEDLAKSFNIRQKLKDGVLDRFTTDELFSVSCDIGFDLFELIRKDENIDNITWVGTLCNISGRAEKIWRNRKSLGWDGSRII